ncbi:MAG: rRNA pseudouridine synthase, partial [Planctomycetes bacterium]|nr:rRNA pseudouridine synthase [Planctomycetota bacterium]
MEERLQKYMARCGVDSRRKCEELIARGLVELNGEVVREPGIKIDPMRDRVKVDGKVLREEKPAHYIHYKVKGVTTTVSDDLGRKTVMDCLPAIRERVYPVGRLDRESEGLLVLTNDGAMANYLTHPAHGIEKTYRVVAEGRISEQVLQALAEQGIRLGPVVVKPSRVELVRYDNENTVVLISVAEGINREVRRIFAALGHEVKRLLRIQVGPLTLTGMKRGGTRPILPKELAILRRGMAQSDPDEEATMFPAGSAASRKPTGPRGRPKRGAAQQRGKAPRQGKPDPAAHAPSRPSAPSAPRGSGKGRAAGKAAASPARGERNKRG